MTDDPTYVRVDGDLLRVTVRGEGAPDPAHHDSAGTSRCAPLERELNRNGFQTIAYDASGTGNSSARLVPLRPSGPLAHTQPLGKAGDVD